MNDEKVLYSVKDIANMFSVSKSFVYRQIWDNKIKPIKLGKRTLIDIDDFCKVFGISIEKLS